MNPFQKSFSGAMVSKAGVPNFDPIFSSGYPYAMFDGNAYAAMKARPGINHPWVYAAISTIISSYVQCPFRLKNKRAKDGEELIDDHPILKLLAAPNPHMQGANFLEMIVWALDLPVMSAPGGQCFIWGDGANFRKGQIPDELWLQADGGIKPILNQQKILQEWEFSYVSGVSPYDYGQGMRLELQEVIRINYFNPHNNLGGVSPVYPIRTSIANDAGALEMNAARIANGGSARGVYSAKKPMSPAQMEEFKANIKKYTEGPENNGKDRYLPWEMQYDQLTMSAEDMDYMGQLGWDQDTIRAALKVSKFALQQYEDLNYATAKEAKRQLFDQAILPMNNMIMEHFNQSWLQYVGKGDLVLCVDVSNVTALHDDMDARFKRSQILVEMGIPPLIALKMNKIPTDDLKSFKWLMENQSAAAALQAKPADANGDPKPKDKPPVKGKGYRIKAILTEEERSAKSADFIKGVFSPGEMALAVSVRRFFNDQRNRNLDLVDAWAKANKSKAVTKAEGDDQEDTPDHIYPMEPTLAALTLDPVVEHVRLAAMMRPYYDSQAKRAAEGAKAQIEAVTRHPVEIQIQAATEDFIRRRLHELSEVNRTTFKGVEDDLAAVIARANADELSVADTAKAIREGLQDTYEGRKRDSNTIARTETATITAFVTHASGISAKMETHGWLRTDDEKTRDSHIHCGEEGMIPMGEKFSNGLEYPSESKTGTNPLTGKSWASEVINCRCTEIFGLLPVEVAP